MHQDKPFTSYSCHKNRELGNFVIFLKPEDRVHFSLADIYMVPLP